MTTQELQHRKRESGLTNHQIAERSGVPLGTVQKIFSGRTVSPRYNTLKALEQVFLEEETPAERRLLYHDRYPGSELLRFAADAPAYGSKKQGEYTLEDYYRIPDDQRVELINGVIFVTDPPNSIHQMLAGKIYASFLSLITEHSSDSIPFIAPSGVQLHCDNKTMLDPDVYIVCDRHKILRSHVYGAPDLVVEILSASTAKKDMTIKLENYLKAGVKEYWMVDPDKMKIIVYTFCGEIDLSLYGFEDSIPIGISEGKCSLDFSKIYESIRFLYG